MESEILKRITKYCADAEKCTQDVLSKLESWDVPEDEHQKILEKLRSENFLDDKRYVKRFVDEKWKLDKWGKLKIENALRQKEIDEALITGALSDINEEEYLDIMHEVLRKKAREVKTGKPGDDAKRVMLFAQGRGFEEDLVLAWMEEELLNDQ